MDLKIKGKVAIVTGAARGIGRACAISLGQEGVKLGINDINEEDGNAFAKELQQMGIESCFVQGDVTSTDDVKTLFRTVHDRFGQIDILVNNAGISPKLPFYDITPEMFGHVLDVNLKSNFVCSKEAFEYMKDNGWGRIVSLSSLAGVHGGIFSAAHYSASKAGIIGLTKTLAKQMGKYNITVNCVAPGRIATHMTDMLSDEQKEEIIKKIPIGRLGQPEEIASVITFLASEGGSYITGTCVEILGGYIG